VCLGASLARVEGQVALATLFGRYQELRQAVPAEDLPLGGNFLCGFTRLPMVF
jgi:cytochrome P450